MIFLSSISRLKAALLDHLGLSLAKMPAEGYYLSHL
jgi:hypothetical protein